MIETIRMGEIEILGEIKEKVLYIETLRLSKMNKNDVKWIYYSSIGEIEIWGKNKEEIVSTLKIHGIININTDKIIQVKPNTEHEEVR